MGTCLRKCGRLVGSIVALLLGRRPEVRSGSVGFVCTFCSEGIGSREAETMTSRFQLRSHQICPG